MTLNRDAWISSSTRILALAALVWSACTAAPTRPSRSRDGGGEDETGGASGEGGSSGRGGSAGSGGRGGAGGRAGAGGTGGAEKADASVSPRPDSGPPPPDAAAKLDVKLDGKKDISAAAAETWEKLNLVLANCVYCHNDPTKRLDLQESGLHGRLVNTEAERVAPGCPNKVLVVPNDPMASLLYQKLTGTMPEGCGERMPYKKPAVSDLELQFVRDWINAGAPGK
jgi:hypothetical protein